MPIVLEAEKTVEADTCTADNVSKNFRGKVKKIKHATLGAKTFPNNIFWGLGKG